MKKLKTAAELDQIFREYKENPNVDSMGAVFEALWLLAKNVLKYVKFKGIKRALKNRTNTYSRLVAFSFIKIERFDPTKGRAFNFFTTIMLSWLRQEYMTRFRYSDLKAKYEERIEDTTNRKQKVYRA